MSHPDHRIVCRNCSLSTLCLPVGLEPEDLDVFDSIVKRSKPLRKGEHLFYEGEVFQSVYIIRSGTIKGYHSTSDGEEQISGFFLPSELLGISGVELGTYPISAQVLETTIVCEIPYEKLDNLCEIIPRLRKQVLMIMGRRIREDQQMKLLLSQKSASERIASFLIGLSERYARRGFSSQAFRLAMSRNEIGNYLGLALETVSRVFSRFQKCALINANGKEIEIINMLKLREIADSLDVETKKTFQTVKLQINDNRIVVNQKEILRIKAQ